MCGLMTGVARKHGLRVLYLGQQRYATCSAGSYSSMCGGSTLMRLWHEDWCIALSIASGVRFVLMLKGSAPRNTRGYSVSLSPPCCSRHAFL